MALLEALFPGCWRFVGDWKIDIGGKNPDFIGLDGQMKLIELFGAAWHTQDEVVPRIAHFGQFGYDTLIVWANELKMHNREALTMRLQQFHHSRKGGIDFVNVA